VLEQRYAVHQEGLGLGEGAPELIQDGEAVGVEVAPVPEARAAEPSRVGELREAVAAAQYDGRAGLRQEGPSGSSSA